MSEEQVLSLEQPTLDAIFKPRTWDEHIAYWVSQLGSPPMMVLTALLLLNSTLSRARPSTWAWSGLYLCLGMVLPLTYIILQVRRGNITDIDVQLREQRSRPFIVTIGGSIIAWLVMWLGGAPAPLTIVAGAVALQSLLIFLITLRWKISVHSATAASTTVLVLRLVGMPAMPMVITLPLIAWSRVRLKRHTAGQTLAGMALGSATFITIIWLSPGL